MRTPVAVRKHKEPTELDFHTFFDVVDNRIRDEILRTGMPGQPPSLHLYSNDTRTTTSFFILTENPHDVTEIQSQLLKKYHDEYDHYVTVCEAWSIADEKELDLGGHRVDKKQEVLIMNGTSKTYNVTITYNIIREKPEDDNSRVLAFEKLADSRLSGEKQLQTTIKNEEDYKKYLAVDPRDGKPNHILFPIKGNTIPWEPSIFESRADLYSYCFGVDDGKRIEGITLFFMPQLQEWLRQNMNKYEIIREVVAAREGKEKEDNEDLMRKMNVDHPVLPYEMEFLSVPLGDIPSGIIVPRPQEHKEECL